MGSGYKKLYEASEQERKTLEQLVRSQEKEIEILEKEIEIHEEIEANFQKQVDALLKICEGQR